MCPRQACACARVRVQVVMILRPLPLALGAWIPPSGAASARGAWKGPGLAGDSWPRWVLPIWNTLCVLLTFRFQVAPLLLTFRFQLVPVLLTFRYQVTAEAMSSILPKELTPGVARGQILKGRVCVLNQGKNPKAVSYTHLTLPTIYSV